MSGTLEKYSIEWRLNPSPRITYLWVMGVMDQSSQGKHHIAVNKN